MPGVGVGHNLSREPCSFMEFRAETREHIRHRLSVRDAEAQASCRYERGVRYEPGVVASVEQALQSGLNFERQFFDKLLIGGHSVSFLRAECGLVRR
jgi:hypothetical protein